MSVSLPNGALVAIAASYGTSRSMTALTNANPGVATLEASHGVLTSDILEVTSGWSKMNGRIMKAGTVATNSVPLLGLNTTSTSLYPAGSGTGSVRVISTWTQLSQILDSSSTGGEQQFLEYQFLEDDAQKRIPTFKSPSGLTFQVADDPTLAGYALLETANDDRLPRAVRITLPSGATIFYNAYVSLNKTPTLSVNQIMAVTATLSFLNEPMRYAA